jgi:uncharacterized membrane protein
MTRPTAKKTDLGRSFEYLIGGALRCGVLISAAVVLLGGIFYLAKYGADPPSYSAFRGEPSDLRSVSGIVKDVLAPSTRGAIQFGLLLLVATPVMRVMIALVGFAWRKDAIYVVVSLIVLTTLAYSLFGGFGC